MSRLHWVWLAIGWLWVAAVCGLSLMPNAPQPVLFDGVDKMWHMLAYAGLMLWFCQVRTGRRQRIGLLLGFAAMGAGIEVLQGMGGYRHFEYADMLANLTGALVGWSLARTPLGRAISLLERDGRHGT